MREEMQKKKETEIAKNDTNNSEDNTDNVKGDNESKKDGKQENPDDVFVDKNGMYYYVLVHSIYSYKMYV